MPVPHFTQHPPPAIGKMILRWFLCLCAVAAVQPATTGHARGAGHGLSSVGCSVVSHGARGDNRTEDTAAAQAALEACDVVLFPAPGRYLVRPLRVTRHGQTVVVQAGAVVVAWPDCDSWNRTAKVQSLFYQDTVVVDPLRGFKMTGGGVIDGQGWRWWPYLKTRPRPKLLQLDHVDGAVVENITFRDSPSFHVLIRGNNFTIRHCRVEANMGSCGGYAAAPNTDAYNIGGTNIHLHDLFAHNGDDCVPTNVGPSGTPTSNVLVERVHCECGTNGGVPIVGAGDHIVSNVLYRDMTINRTGQGIGFKISEA